MKTCKVRSREVKLGIVRTLYWRPSVLICHRNRIFVQRAREPDAAKFLKTHGKTVEVFQVIINEVKELIQAEINSRKTGCVDRRIEDLVERYRSATFRERVPDNLPRLSPDMPQAEM